MKLYRITAEGGRYRLPCANCGEPRVVDAVLMVGPDGKEMVVCPPPAAAKPTIITPTLPPDEPYRKKPPKLDDRRYRLATRRRSK